MSSSQGTGRGLPGNAYTPLKPGETYVPVIPADKIIPEVTPRSVIFGLVMAAVFSAAAAFLGLKVGQVFEAAIPIAILAVGFSALFKRRSTISENVMMQSIGAASGVVVAGAVFTLPGLYILGLQHLAEFYKIFLVSMFGGFLGILFLIPLRRYFVAEQHGVLPFPEATATTEILVAGEKGGNQAKVLASAMLVGGLYDFVMLTLHSWKEVFSTRFIPGLSHVAEKFRLEFNLNVGAAVMGLGYIIGVRYAAIIAAGSLLSWFVFIPLIAWFGGFMNLPVPPSAEGLLIGGMDAETIFGTYVRHIGIGGIFAAGVVGIIKNMKIIVGSFSLGFKELGAGKDGTVTKVVRTDRDIKMSFVFMALLGTLLAVWLFFYFAVLSTQPNPLMLSLIALVVVAVISFLFTAVAARAIAIVGTNPVSGMTLMTLIISSLILIAAGLKGDAGMVAGLLIGGVVCTALSMSGGFITDLKIGYWLGTTPRNQQMWKFLGTIVAALSVGGVIIVLDNAYGFAPDRPDRLIAPQANAMAAVIKTFMSEAPVPWVLYGVGAAIALIMEMMAVPALAFALGMYIPLELNTPILAGAIVAWFVKRSAGKDEALGKARHERGTLIASGFIAGGAIMGVVAALLKWGGVNLSTGLAAEDWSNYLSLFVFLGLALYVYWDARRARSDD